MDKYDASNDHYCYSGTNTLKNKLDIKDMDTLEKAEREITVITAEKIIFKYPPYDLSYMQMLHSLLFSDLYDWAGNIRNVDISKGGTRFCNCQRIEPESKKLFGSLEKENWLQNIGKEVFCKKLGEYYCEINMLHPFREGNGRVQRLLFEHLSLAAGYDLDWADVSADEWIQANIDGVNVKYASMEKIFNRIITSCT
ncbi:MAG: putative adenosine monophosphate-protein transferase Fic [Rhodoferax sp.]|uniref:putative adenosine monophosphate-protein transferase Fic n=1 Tax=Rhodoferax sp. TaxID=50421 RepID=UPI003266C982